MGGQHKAKSRVASGKKLAAALKKAGKGIFKPVTYSAALAKIVGKGKGTRSEAVKGVWAYIKKAKLNSGRMIKADATLKTIFAGGSMFKLAGAMSKQMK